MWLGEGCNLPSSRLYLVTWNEDIFSIGKGWSHMGVGVHPGLSA